MCRAFVREGVPSMEGSTNDSQVERAEICLVDGGWLHHGVNHSEESFDRSTCRSIVVCGIT